MLKRPVQPAAVGGSRRRKLGALLTTGVLLASGLTAASGALTTTSAVAAPGDAFDSSVPTVFISQQSPTQLYRSQTNPDGTFSFFEEGVRQTLTYNAIGYDPASQYIYGIATAGNAEIPSGAVVRIGQDGVVTRLGTSIFSSNGSTNFQSGAVADDGYYYIWQQGSSELFQIDLADGSLSQTITTSVPANWPDITFADGYAWSLTFAGELVRTDLATGTVSVLDQVIPDVVAGGYGAAWTFGNGNLGFSSNGGGNVYQIKVTDPASPEPTIELISVTAGPSSSTNDGTAIPGLPADLSLEKATPAEHLVGGQVTYTFTVTNNGEGSSSGWTVSDTIPAGLSNPVVPQDVTNAYDSETRTMTVSGGRLEAGDTFTFSVVADSELTDGECVTNEATVLGNESDGDDSNNDASATSCALELAEDFGDAPNSFGTSLAADGPRHAIPGYDAETNTAPVMLGSLIDSEEDGQPGATADGDDVNGVDDEDGVLFNTDLGYPNPTLRTGLNPVSRQPIENTLDISASADGFVSVWVDWNQDGIFTEDEQVVDAQAVTAGTNQVSFTQGENPDSTSSHVRVRYSTDPGSIATPIGDAPDGEVEDYRVLIERLLTPDVCSVSTNDYYAFTFATPVESSGGGGAGTMARYANVTVVNGVSVDMIVEVLAGRVNSIRAGDTDGIFGIDDARWQINGDATLRYSFVDSTTGEPVAISGAFTVSDMDGPPNNEHATFAAADLAGYGVTSGSAVRITEVGSNIVFSGSGSWNGDPQSRFQIALEGISTFDARWQGGSNSGFGFDGDGDFAIDPVCLDFGDAPDSYGTLLGDDGARHQVVPGLTLGTTIDFDEDGYPSDDALGDDENGLADEDGVSSPIVVIVGSETVVTVSATNNTDAAATIGGWIDLNGNGTFDAAELVTVSVPANSGTADYALTFPAGSVTDDTFARFRLFPADVNTFLPIGEVNAGEVEDYAVTVLERELAIEKSSDMTVDSRPGDTVEYTVVATNTGTADYTTDVPAIVFDDLAGVLDDAEYNSDAVAVASDGSDVSTPSFLPPSFLSWSGPLAAGESVTMTYTVTLAGGGDGTVRNVAWQPATPPVSGEPPVDIPTCDPRTGDGTDPVTGEPCGATENLLPKLSIDKKSDVTELAADGGVVTYTVTVTNDGPGVYTDAAPATVTDSLADVLDDAEFGQISAPADGASFDADAQEITWTGPLGVGESKEITYTVTYDSTTGDNILYNVACIPAEDAATPGADCADVQLPGAALRITKSADPADGTRVLAGQEVTYTVSFENIGEAAASVDVVDDLSNVFDDATLIDGSIITSAPSLTATLSNDELAIEGSVPAGETITVKYTVTVNAYADQGDHVLGNVVTNADGDCPVGGCPETEHPVRHVSVTKSATPTEGVQTGDTVEYTVVITNDGQADYTAVDPAALVDNLAEVLDDATYNSDAVAVASDGSQIPEPAFSSPLLGWEGPLAVGESVTITYTVTVNNLGDHSMLNTAGPVCADGELCDPPVEVEVLLPYITPSKSSDPASGEALSAGDVVTYTLSWANTGQAAGAVDSTDDLSNVLDDGQVTSDPTVDEGHADDITAVFDVEAQTIRVTGELAPGETTTVTYQVTVGADGERGDNIVGNVLTPDVPEYICVDGDLECEPVDPPTTEHPVGELDDWKSVDPASGSTVQAGQVVTYTLSFENTGEAVVEVNREDVLSGVLDDATVTTAPTASDAALAVSDVADGRFAVTGALEPGQLVTVTYQVTVNANGARGDDRLGNFLVDNGEEPPTECVPTDDERADCTVNHVSDVVVSKSADPASGTEVQQGQKVTYTLTFENVSTNVAAADVSIDYTDHMAGVLDDANLTAGPTPSDAGVAALLAGDTIRITGAVASGDTVTVTYAVTVKAYDQQGDHVLGNVVAITGEQPVCAPDSSLCTTHDLPEPPPLAITGGEIAWWSLALSLILLVGGGALVLARRRREDERVMAVELR